MRITMRKPLNAAPMVVGMVLAAASGFGRAQMAPNNAGRDFGQQPATQVAPPVNLANTGVPNAATQQNAAGQSDFPQDEVHDWVVASARAARAQAMLHLSEKQLNDAIRDAQWTFENSQEYKEAAIGEKQAYNAYTAERQRALKSVLGDSKYQAALQLCDELSDKIAKYRAMAKPGQIPREELLALASQKLQYASDAHNMERDALDKDAAVQDARQKMVQASARANELRAAFDRSIRMNPQIVQARRNLDQADVDLITAQAYCNAAALAGEVATDYSYYRHRWDGIAAPVGAGWGPYGYGSGY
jgi:hypothetical protein